MMFIIPLFSIDLYRDPENVWDYLLLHQSKLLELSNSTVPINTISELISSQIK